jgi:hypothetical protein
MSPNKNYSTDTGDAEPDMSDTGEGGENELTFSTGDYPELEGIQEGAMVDVRCKATVTGNDNGNVSLAVQPGCEISTEGQADKAMKEMSQQDSAAPAQGASPESDF